MKKIISLLLCVMLILSCAVAIAEDSAEKEKIGTISINGAFDLRCKLPEGYRVQPRKLEGTQVSALIVSDKPEKPMMQLSIVFDEAYADVDRMNDLDDEALEEIERSFTDVDPTIEITYGDTGLGTRLLIARQSNDYLNYIDFFSIYKGYMVEFVVIPSQTAEDKTLTDEQYQMCIDFLTELDFVPADGVDPETSETEAAEAEDEIVSEND